MATLKTPWGPTGEAVYKRTYSREKSNGIFETWPDTVARVVHGNIALVHGNDPTLWSREVMNEAIRLGFYMDRFAILPAGRQLWASGVEGRQYLFNCHVSGWEGDIEEHFMFTFMRLVEGGGVGANYSDYLVRRFGAPHRPVDLKITATPRHADYAKMAPYLDSEYLSDAWRVPDTREGWSYALGRLIHAAWRDDNEDDQALRIEFDLSGIRKEGSPLITSGGTAAGPAPLAVMLRNVADIINKSWAAQELSPIALMEIDHAVSIGAIAGGKRRSARMSILKWDDPYVFDFINSKSDTGAHWTTNISIEIDDEFLDLLTFPESTDNVRAVMAKEVHRAACVAVLSNGEPGYWNSSLARKGEPGYIIATNPCGEIPLEAWEACNLGHVNMDYFANRRSALGYDNDALEEAHRLITRFLIRSTYGDINDPRQRYVMDRNRRIGVGHHGVQGFFIKALETRYSDVPKDIGSGASKPSTILKRLKRVVDETAIAYCHDLRIPVPVKRTCIAPGGTVPKLPGVTEGIGAIYARWFEQRIRFSLRDEREFEQVSDYRAQGFKIEDDIYDPSGMTAVVVFPTENNLVSQVRDLGLDTGLVESQEQLTLRDMLEFQAFYQEHWADNAIAYTANIPAGTVTPEELEVVLAQYLPRLKGTTIMVDATREQAPYTRISHEAYTVALAKTQADAIDESCASGACPVR